MSICVMMPKPSDFSASGRRASASSKPMRRSLHSPRAFVVMASSVSGLSEEALEERGLVRRGALLRLAAAASRVRGNVPEDLLDVATAPRIRGLFAFGALDSLAH